MNTIGKTEIIDKSRRISTVTVNTIINSPHINVQRSNFDESYLNSQSSYNISTTSRPKVLNSTSNIKAYCPVLVSSSLLLKGNESSHPSMIREREDLQG